MNTLDSPALAESLMTPPAGGVIALRLHNFRCYQQLEIECDTRALVLTGKNGAGKTNILEALSFLTPGRGLRRATLRDIINRNNPEKSWAISTTVSSGKQNYEIGVGLDPDSFALNKEKRITRIDGDTAKSQTEINQYLTAIWLTPNMDRLFMDTGSNRRSFIDRLVYSSGDSAHIARLGRYERAMRERNRLLHDGSPDPRWMTGIEEQIANEGIAITVARTSYLAQLQQHMGKGSFPIAKLAMVGDVEKWLTAMTCLQAEEHFIKQLHTSRVLDASIGRTSVGIHRSDLDTRFEQTAIPAKDCSTGEQKAMLISIILAATRMQTGNAVLLLDEIVAHLDAIRRTALYEEISELGVQTWMTGTDKSAFQELGNRAQFFHIENTNILQQNVL